MKASDLTYWGVFLLHLRGMSAGVVLSYFLRRDTFAVPERSLMICACGILVGTGLISPILRVLGWRGLEEHVGDAKTFARHRDVERELRSALDDGMSLQEAVRFLHLSRGWDVLLLSPAVAAVAGLPSKDAIRLVIAATSSAAPEKEVPPGSSPTGQ
jgi:hypothetical protein